MDLKRPQIEEVEDRGRAFSRRRKLAAVIVGVMMLSLFVDDPTAQSIPPSDSQSQNTVSVDEFDRVEALLAKSENTATDSEQGIHDSGEEIWPESDLPVERPDFDFNIFESEFSVASESTRLQDDTVAMKERGDNYSPTPKPTTRLNSHSELHIPETLALGTGQRIDMSPVVISSTDSKSSADLPKNDHVGFGTKRSDAGRPVRILASDVVASQVTRFPVDKAVDANNGNSEISAAEVIHFTGRIYPVSRRPN